MPIATNTANIKRIFKLEANLKAQILQKPTLIVTFIIYKATLKAELEIKSNLEIDMAETLPLVKKKENIAANL